MVDNNNMILPSFRQKVLLNKNICNSETKLKTFCFLVVFFNTQYLLGLLYKSTFFKVTKILFCQKEENWAKCTSSPYKYISVDRKKHS